METFLWIILATLVNTALGLSGAITLLMTQSSFHRTVEILVALSAGALLGGALFHLIPESFSRMSELTLGLIVVLGFLLFFIIEEYLHWHHCHGDYCPQKTRGYLLMIGDMAHNLIDGIVIASAFFVNVGVGIVTTLVILAHEFPQELGIFALLAHGGMKKGKALLYSTLAQATCILGGIIGFLFLNIAEQYSIYLLPFAAGGFLYISAADIIPDIHKSKGKWKVISFVSLLAGLALMVGLKIIFE